VVYFAPRILSGLGFTREASIALTAAIGVLQILCGLGLARVIDRVGRKPAALVGSGGRCSRRLVDGVYSRNEVWHKPNGLQTSGERHSTQETRVGIHV
jgi:hypothetical protein